ncbi:glycogen/starch synthase [Verrucomicrobiaceae bacterium N1E253]|uniref:starch synthase n=2 Tax=Oceaniferula marina TaxID=2748318 RepID=A0A851GDJ2_9BACT|nr:glycogen/starch synthase [Oceaniferula marina]
MNRENKPTILVVTPEITYLPEGMGNMAQRMSAKAGGMADVSASLVSALYDQGADVHVALPNYRRMFNMDIKSVHDREYQTVRDTLGKERIHLAEDRIFYHRDQVYASENRRMALAFQREIINHIIPQVKPDLIHCNDWMTGLIPAVARRFGIPCLYTVHNIHTEKMTMDQIEDRGIDAAEFWNHLYFEHPPYSYEESRETNPTDFLASGIFAADHVNTVSQTFLYEVVEGKHSFVPDAIRSEMASKLHAGCATGILNAPDVSYDPETDPALEMNYTHENVMEGKAVNKRALQERIGLEVRPDAPLFFWPSRLDPMQKGCQLLADILYQMVDDHSDIGLQVAIIANGSFQKHFHNIVELHGLQNRVAVVDFTEDDSRLGYAAADFMMMPSRFEPCGLPQMVSPKYGTLSVAHDTGGIHDTVEHMHHDGNLGNGFRFQYYSPEGLRWGIDEAVGFYKRSWEDKDRILSRVMRESSERFNHDTTAAAYIQRYETMLGKKVGN